MVTETANDCCSKTGGGGMAWSYQVVTNKQKQHQQLTPCLNELIGKLRELVHNDKNLVCGNSDEFLTRFIKASNYDLQKSYNLVKDYFLGKKEHPEVFRYAAPCKYVHIISRPDLGFVLPHRDFEGRRIIYLKFGNIDPGREESWSELMQAASITLESLSLDVDIQDKGVDLILDCTNFSLKIMKWATPYKLKVTTKLLQECIPLRFDSYHIVNPPFVFNVFYAALKPFLKEELARRMHWHRAPFDSLGKFMDISCLPPHLGGTLSLSDITGWYTIVLDKEDELKEFDSMKYI